MLTTEQRAAFTSIRTVFRALALDQLSLDARAHAADGDAAWKSFVEGLACIR